MKDQCGTKNHKARINDSIVFEMRKLRAGGMAIIDIANRFNVHEETAREVVRLQSWRHVATPYDKFLSNNHENLRRDKTIHRRLTLKFIRRIFKYDPEEGILRWNIRSRGVPYGERAGSIANAHYSVRISDKVIFTHVVIWFYMTGKWPKNLVDHKDGDSLNNKWSNLREATQSQNMMNARLRKDNTTGCKGVYKHKPSGLWKVIISVNKITHYLGYFKTFEEAVAARRAAEQKYHGEFARPQ